MYKTVSDIQQHLFDLRDEQYAAFQAKLTPGIPAELFIGVRVPQLRCFAKELYKSQQHTQFLASLPHKYYDENMLHGMLVSLIKDYDQCLEATGQFLPHVDNWAVCDTMSPRVFARHKGEFIDVVKRWSASAETYTCRFGLKMLMSHYLDDDFLPEYLDIAASARSDEYYVKMMVAWYFATALAKQWDATIPVIEERLLAPWTHNKAIQKARESFRITPEQKEYLNTLKIKTNK